MSSRKTMHSTNPTPADIEKWKEFIFGLQQSIVAGLQEHEEVKFTQNKWEREDKNGDGIACIIEEGKTYEKAGVNVTQLRVPLNKGIYKTMSDQMHLQSIKEEEIDQYDMFACGLSLVIHPLNPYVPTTHANYRLLVVQRKDNDEVKDWWFGGGSDLTPIYLSVSDAIHFHKIVKEACDKHDYEYYPKYKKAADDYF